MTEDANGYIKWRDLDQHRETEATARHILADKIEQRISGIDMRVNTLESVIDQQRGARALVYTLIGTNLLAVAAVIWGVVRA